MAAPFSELSVTRQESADSVLWSIGNYGHLGSATAISQVDDGSRRVQKDGAYGASGQPTDGENASLTIDFTI